MGSILEYADYSAYEDEFLKAEKIWMSWRRHLIALLCVNGIDARSATVNRMADMMLDGVYRRLGTTIVDQPCSGFDVKRFKMFYGWVQSAFVSDAAEIMRVTGAGFGGSCTIWIAAMMCEVWYDYYMIHVNGDDVLIRVEPRNLYSKRDIVKGCIEVLFDIIPRGVCPEGYIAGELLQVANWSIRRRNMLVPPGTRPMEPLRMLSKDALELVRAHAEGAEGAAAEGAAG